MTDGANTGELRVAYVTCRYPPMTSSGTFRVEAMMSFLPEHHIRPTVITIPEPWVRQQQGGLEAEIPAHEPDVIRPHATGDDAVRILSSIPVLRRGLREAVVPDILAPWARGVAAEASAEVGECDVVYATSPPFSAMLLGDRMAQLLDVPCVQEVRDPPSFNRRLRGRSRLTVRRMFDLEERYLGRADAVISVTKGMRSGLLERHPSFDPDRHHVVTNGYPEMDVDPSLSGRRPDRFTVAYIGSFQGSERARPASWFTPEILIPALQALPAEPELRIVGPVTAGQRSALARYGSVVTLVGRVPRQTALAEVASADVCLVLAEDDPWWIGRKVFEYLAYARRVLAVVPAGDTADLLANTEKARVTPLGDEGALVAAVADLFDEWRRGPVDPRPEPGVQTDRSCAAGVAKILRDVVAAG